MSSQIETPPISRLHMLGADVDDKLLFNVSLDLGEALPVLFPAPNLSHVHPSTMNCLVLSAQLYTVQDIDKLIQQLVAIQHCFLIPNR
jgi:hypothetical protein